MLALHALGERFDELRKVVGESEAYALSGKSIGKRSCLLIGTPARQSFPLRDDRFLHRHGAIEVGHEFLRREGGNEGEARNSGPFDILQFVLANCYERAHLNKGSIPRR